MVRRFSSSFTLFFSLILMINSSLFAYAETSHRTPSIKKQQALLHLLKQDCGSCHGMLLKGGLGPPLLMKNLEDKPIELIINTILYGRPGTAMPPWQGLLSTQDATWLAQQLKTGVIE
ncbi:c-type cytochrome [Spartinivicinus marinus]|nr:cytochrome c [Spartinivicinus marinus]MCX4024845.1 cytochrome c [Spartinivicinus marinus]